MKYTSKVVNNIQEVFNLVMSSDKHVDLFQVLPQPSIDMTAIEVSQTPTHVIIGYLKYQQNPSPFFQHSDDIGEFKEFTNIYKRDEYLSTLKKSSLFYLVDKYAHGSIDYSISGSKDYPDSRWDVSKGCAVFIPCDYIQDEYKKAKKTMTVQDAKTKFINDSNSILKEYSDYSNGEVYSYTVTTYDNKGKIVNEEDNWEIIGFKNANESKSSVMENEFLESYALYYMQELNIEKFESANQIPDISKETLEEIKQYIDLKDIKSVQYVEIYGEKLFIAINNAEDSSFLYHDNANDKPTISSFTDFLDVYKQTKRKEEIIPEDLVKKFTEKNFSNEIKKVIRDNLEKQNDNKSILKIK